MAMVHSEALYSLSNAIRDSYQTVQLSAMSLGEVIEAEDACKQELIAIL